MISKEVLARRLSEGSLAFSSFVVEQALGNDTLRGVVMGQLEKRILAQILADAHPGLPTQVTNDKLDMIRALVRSASRALERKQISHPVRHRLLQTLLANLALGQDREAQLARQRSRPTMRAGGAHPDGHQPNQGRAICAVLAATPARERAASGWPGMSSIASSQKPRRSGVYASSPSPAASRWPIARTATTSWTWSASTVTAFSRCTPTAP